LQVRILPDPLDRRSEKKRAMMALQEQWEKLRDAGPRSVNFLTEAWAEMKKVHWPSRNEAYAATLIVLVVTVIIASFLGIVDFAISFVLQKILG
jgi:preprotein translocase subunit SecE